MNRSRANSSIFLIELAVVILIFSVCAAITMRVFAGAHQMTRESEALSRGVIAAQSVAECYKAADGDPAQTAAFSGGVQDGDTVRVYYSGGWSRVQEDAAYVVTLFKDGGYAEISIAPVLPYGGAGATIYTITVKAVE